MFSRALTLFFFACVLKFGSTKNTEESDQRDLYSAIQHTLEAKGVSYADSLTRWLEDYNDRHIGESDIGRALHYNEIKTSLIGPTGRGHKKMSLMTMMPLLFHVGASSTWMLITAIMAAKSVAIGLTLLVFKIAVSSAKLASFFTHMKKDHHHGWTEHHEPHVEIEHEDHHSHDHDHSTDHHDHGHIEHHDHHDHHDHSHHDHSNHDHSHQPDHHDFSSYSPYWHNDQNSYLPNKEYGSNLPHTDLTHSGSFLPTRSVPPDGSYIPQYRSETEPCDDFDSNIDFEPSGTKKEEYHTIPSKLKEKGVDFSGFSDYKVTEDVKRKKIDERVFS